MNNFEDEYLGPIDLTKAIAVSDNSVFSQLTALVGPGNVRTTPRELGITTPLQPYFSIGLGAEPATPLEMARAYMAFVDGGDRIDSSLFGNQPRVVQQVTANGKVTENKPVPVPVLTSTQAETITQMLQGVVLSGHRASRRAPRARGRRQDGYDRELRRRVVRRLHPAARRRGVGRLSRTSWCR